jgi:radical SAM protein with 4Fe4S-binding SPASM domain
MSIIDITDSCNLDCVYCCRKNRLDEKNDVNFESLIDAINQIKDCRGTFVVLQGGEPLIRKDVVKIINEMGKLKQVKPGIYLKRMADLIKRYLPSKRFKKFYIRALIEQELPLYCITTNGMIYSSDIEEALYNSGFSLEISLDSPTPKTNDLSRVGSNTKKIIENIEKYSKRLPVELSCTITETNVDDLHDMLALADETSCICVKYSPVIMIGKRSKDGSLWEKKYLNSLDKILDIFVFKKYNFFLKVKLNKHVLNLSEGKKIYEKLLSAPNVILELHECAAFKKIKDFYIDTKLDVYGCASMKNDKSLVVGNLYESKLKEIWSSDRRKKLLKKITPYCNEKECFGSCTAVAYNQSNPLKEER